MDVTQPKAVIILSGKRKSGKDYTADSLLRMLGEQTAAILRLSAPLKAQYAREHGLDFQRLLDSSEYKEQHRVDMIRWGEAKRDLDPGFFCRQVALAADRPVWIISDARRLTDVAFFCEHYQEQVITVRVRAQDEVRAARGWTFTPGVDDAPSECGLDSGVTWNYVINNSGDNGQLYDKLMEISETVRFRLGHL